MNEFRQRLIEPEIVDLFDYWCARRGARAMPSRKDVDPVQIPKHLPNLMLVDVLRDPLRFRYRLVGTRVVAASTDDRTGQFFDQVRFFDANPAVAKHYEAVVANAEPHYSDEPFHNRQSDSIYRVQRLLLPLSSDGVSVDMILVYFHFKTGPYAGR